MWIDDLGKLYNESLRLDNPAPPSIGSIHYRPVETTYSKPYKGSFNKGTDDYNPMTTPTYNGTQQEESEDPVSKILNVVNRLIDRLDRSNNQDVVALNVLGTLKTYIETL